MNTGGDFFQVCWVVPNLESAMRAWLDTTPVGPFFVNNNVQPSGTRYRGQPSMIRRSLALSHTGSIQIELIEQHCGSPSVYRESVPPGERGFHHMARFTEDLRTETERYQALGVPAVYDGLFGDMCFAYFDTRPQLGFMTEVLERNSLVERLFTHIFETAQSWDGRNPIRPFPAL